MRIAVVDIGSNSTRLLVAETAPVGVTVFSAQAVALDYTEEFAATLRRRRLAPRGVTGLHLRHLPDRTAAPHGAP